MNSCMQKTIVRFIGCCFVSVHLPQSAAERILCFTQTQRFDVELADFFALIRCWRAGQEKKHCIQGLSELFIFASRDATAIVVSQLKYFIICT